MTLKNNSTSIARTKQVIRDSLDAAIECARDMKRRLGDDSDEFYTIAGELAIVWEAVSELADTKDTLTEAKKCGSVKIYDTEGVLIFSA